MDAYLIRYHPTTLSSVPIRRTLILILTPVMLILVGFQVYLAGQLSEPFVPLLILPGVLAVLIVIMFVQALFWRRQPPPNALRLDWNGVWVWLPILGDFHLPWDAVGSVTVTNRGLQVRPAGRANGDLPGSLGFTDINVRWAMAAGPQVAWRYTEPVDPVGLDAALRHYSRGRIGLSQG